MFVKFKYTFYLCFVLGLKVSAQTYLSKEEDRRIKVVTADKVIAFPVNQSQVKLQRSSFLNARNIDEKFLEQIEPNRLLAGFRKNAGLAAKGNQYGSWESMGLAGHTLGHYLSALSLHYGSTQNAEALKRVNYIVSELSEIQKARKTGYLGAIPGEDKLWNEVKSGKIETSNFNLNGVWAPWYTVHKIMAGLLDSYLYTGNKNALELQINFANWANDLLSKLSEEQMQNMLKCEYGGMAEVLVNTYALTGDEKFLKLSYRFYDKEVLDPLAQKVDQLQGFHANTIIPKAIASARRYALVGDENDKNVAQFFWKTVVENHTFALGGNSYYEYFHAPGQLNDKLADNTAETCNTYNMLKLTQHLFALEPQAHFMDFYERALYNHILASQHPKTGMTTYYMSHRMGGKKEFGDYQNSFTCCMATGMENHVKYNDAIYFKGLDGSIFVNLYIPSETEINGFKIKQSGEIPSVSRVEFTVEASRNKAGVLRFRKPIWAKNFYVSLNGVRQKDFPEEDGYIVISRQWKGVERVALNMESDFYTINMPDNENRKAIFYGPLMLAADLGVKEVNSNTVFPVFVTEEKEANKWLKRISPTSLIFETINNSTYPRKLTFKPFNVLTDEHYNIYSDFFTPDEWEKQQEVYEKESKERREKEAKTVSYFRPGEMQPERDHNLTGEDIFSGENESRKWRAAKSGGFISFEMKVNNQSSNQLLLEYWGKDNRNSIFDILVDGVVVGTEDISKFRENRFYEIAYDIPQNLTRNKEKVIITLKGKQNTGPFYSARIIAEDLN